MKNITTKQRAYLRSLAANTDTIMQVGKGGVGGKVNISLTAEETAKLQNSANTLKEVIRNLDI